MSQTCALLQIGRARSGRGAWATEEFEAHTGIECCLNLSADAVTIDPERATAIFRILQEALTNVARHSGATQVDVRLAVENGRLTLEVRDNGIGI